MLSNLFCCAGTRDSQAGLLLGQEGWVIQRQHGIKYSLDVTRCMFSSGNVTERARMGRMACHGQTIVDLFTGIGYFTLPLLVHAGEASPRLPALYTCRLSSRDTSALCADVCRPTGTQM